MRDILLVFLRTGLRLSELTSLTWDNVNLKASTITIFKSKTSALAENIPAANTTLNHRDSLFTPPKKVNLIVGVLQFLPSENRSTSESVKVFARRNILTSIILGSKPEKGKILFFGRDNLDFQISFRYNLWYSKWLLSI